MSQLSYGTRVAYTGPDLTVDDVLLVAGARGKVWASGGRTAAAGLLTEYQGPGHPLRRLLPTGLRRGQVLVRFDDGARAVVRREDLEALPIEHPARPDADPSSAEPLLEALRRAPRGTVGELVPVLPGHDHEVALVLHPWTRDGTGSEDATWSEVAHALALRRRELLWRNGGGSTEPVDGYDPPSTGQLSQRLAGHLVDVLGRVTSTPDDVSFAVWEGWGSVDPAWWPGAAHVPIPNRGSFLLRGPLSGLTAGFDPEPSAIRGAQLWWPADLAWVAASEIDLPWTAIAGTPEVIATLRAASRLEVVTTTVDAATSDLPLDA